MFALTHKGKKYVTMNISEDGANAALDAVGQLMNGGSIELRFMRYSRRRCGILCGFHGRTRQSAR